MVGAGLLAGAAVEVVRTIATFPLDTVKTRLQLKREGASHDEQDIPERLFDRCLEGLGPALMSSAPQGAVFWSVKDVVRRETLALFGVISGQSALLTRIVPGGLAPPAWAEAVGLDARGFATVVAVGAAEVSYWLVRAPTEVAKTAAQAQTPAILDEADQVEHAEQVQQADGEAEPVAQFDFVNQPDRGDNDSAGHEFEGPPAPAAVEPGLQQGAPEHGGRHGGEADRGGGDARRGEKQHPVQA